MSQKVWVEPKRGERQRRESSILCMNSLKSQVHPWVRHVQDSPQNRKQRLWKTRLPWNPHWEVRQNLWPKLNHVDCSLKQKTPTFSRITKDPEFTQRNIHNFQDNAKLLDVQRTREMWAVLKGKDNHRCQLNMTQRIKYSSKGFKTAIVAMFHEVNALEISGKLDISSRDKNYK